MTTEEKAKAYDKTLEKAKTHINSKGIGDTVDLCKYLFPELAESNDERIRKEIIESLQKYMPTDELLKEQEMIAWLEKQKEQNLELYYDKELDSAAREFYFSGSADSPVDSTGLVPIVRMAEFGATWMKKKMDKEQKPAEWNKEDVNAITTAIRACRYMTEYFENSTKQYEDAIERLKSLRPRWKPSEKQMMKDAVEGVAGDSKQKNSEYDEKYLNFILDLLEDQKKFCKKNAEGARYSKEISSAQTWLKNKFK